MKLLSRLFRKPSTPVVPSSSRLTASAESAARPAAQITPSAPKSDSISPVRQPSGSGAARGLAGAPGDADDAAALASIEDPVEALRLVVEGASSRVRRLAAESIEDPEQLKRLLKQVRNKDKSVYKILKGKLDALGAEERKAAELAQETAAICASLERHSQSTHDARYTAAFEQLNSRWRSLAERPTADVERRCAEAIERCREVIAAQLREAVLQAQQGALRQAALQAARDDRERALREAEEAAAAQAAAEVQLQREAAAAHEAQETLRAQALAAQEQIFREIAELIRKANGALSAGSTQRAAGLRRAIAEKWPAVPVPPHLARNMQQLDDKLNELKQWKDYAVGPKRIELIEEMESLVGVTEEPQVLAARIKSLQEEWRTTGKGIMSDEPEGWQRFHQASQAAYRPCGEYFEAQAKLRQENLQHRQAVLGRLAAFEASLDAENPDAPLLSCVLREAPLEWRRYFPVDRQAGRDVQRDFECSIARLQARLDAWHGRNAAAKQSLVERARHLLALEDCREAVEAVKRLQVLWKEAGPVPRDQDQSLWGEFREACDAVHQKRQQALAEHTAGLEANRVKAAALCEEAERAAALSGPELIEGAAKIAEWRAAFGALGDLPRMEARGLQDRFGRALDLCKARAAEQRQRDVERSFMDLFEAARYIRAYDWAAQNAAASEQETLRRIAETFMAGIQRWPKGGLQALKEALARAGSAPLADVASREKALRTLCIRCEISSGTPTPVEDEPLRREYQVQRLVQRMGQGSRADDDDCDALAFEWMRIGAVAPALHDALQERFMRCRSPQRGSRTES
jgi:hypothetical protein